MIQLHLSGARLRGWRTPPKDHIRGFQRSYRSLASSPFLLGPISRCATGKIQEPIIW